MNQTHAAPNTIEVLDPTGLEPFAATSSPRATGLVSLKSARIGLLHNKKEHGDLLLRNIAEGLVNDYGMQLFGMRRKVETATNVDPLFIKEFLENCDVVVTASAD